jgi:hypothetical protein
VSLPAASEAHFDLISEWLLLAARISTLRDRVCMTAAMLMLDPICDADLSPEQYDYRPGPNAQQAVVKVEETLFRCSKATRKS